MGFVLGAIKLGYATGQLVNGQLTERFGARRILAIGMVGSAVATLLFAAAPWLAERAASRARRPSRPSRRPPSRVRRRRASLRPVAHSRLPFANGWFQSGGWPPVVKVAGGLVPARARGRTMGVLGTSLTIGSAFAIVSVGGFLLGASPAGASRSSCRPSCSARVVRPHVARGFARTRPRAEATAPRAPDRMTLREALAATLGNPRIWILALALFGLDAVRYGFLDWAPGHLAEVHQTGPLSRRAQDGRLPLAGAPAALISGRITDRFFQSRRAPVCAMLLGAVGVLTLAYRAVVRLGAAPTVVVPRPRRLLPLRRPHPARRYGRPGLRAPRRHRGGGGVRGLHRVTWARSAGTS